MIDHISTEVINVSASRRFHAVNCFDPGGYRLGAYFAE